VLILNLIENNPAYMAKTRGQKMKHIKLTQKLIDLGFTQEDIDALQLHQEINDLRAVYLGKKQTLTETMSNKMED